MTDLEMPSLELGRYLELLKRRKWQLVPAAILGLLVGLLVAWLIPRYYEARTRVRLFPTVLSSAGGPRQDPFLAEVRKARITIANPKLLSDAIAKLEDWTDFRVIPMWGKKYRAKLHALTERVWVHDLGGSLDGRTSAWLEIGYRDRDPMRAADFANTICELYIQRERDFVIGSAKSLFRQLSEDAKTKEDAWNEALERRKEFYQKNPGLDPFETNILGKPVHTGKHKAMEALLEELSDLEIRIGAAKRRVEKTLADLQVDGLTKTIPVPIAEIGDAVLVEKISTLVTQIKHYKVLLDAWQPNNHNYEFTQAAYKRSVADLEQLRKQADINQKLEKPNPAYIAAQKAHDEAVTRLKELQIERDEKLAHKKELAKDLEMMPMMLARIADLNARVETAQEAWHTAVTAAKAQETQVAKLEIDGGVIVQQLTEATPPPAPTYPNNWLISMIGGGIGLLVAVGLIFVLDFLRPTWKTVEEVSRALPVPALGGISFLELPEEILASKRRRVRYATIAIVFFVLLGGIVAVYFLEPLRLPTGVQWLLDKILAQGA